MFAVRVGLGQVAATPILQVRGLHARFDRYENDRDENELWISAGDLLVTGGDTGDADAHARELAEQFLHEWQAFPHIHPLLVRAFREAATSDVLLGETPTTWSPLGKLSPESFGALRSNLHLVAAASDGEMPLFVDERLIESNATYALGLRIAGEIVGACAFYADAFVTPLAPGVESVFVSHEVDPANEPEDAELTAAIDHVTADWLAPTRYRRVLVWRLYEGTGTTVTDGVEVEAPPQSGTFRIKPTDPPGSGPAEQIGRLLVGRVVKVAAKPVKHPRDPLAASRRTRWEKLAGEAAQSAPDIRDHAEGLTSAAIAIHGTHGCALPLADRLRAEARGRVQVLRFEHDTWLPPEDNIEELLVEIRRLRLDRVLLVGHSRGGLLARDVAGSLPAGTATALTLGAPFDGTPWAASPRAVLMGSRMLLGALRGAGGMVVDSCTRLAGLMLLRRPPAGLEAMTPGAPYLRHFGWTPPPDWLTTVAGHCDPFAGEHFTARVKSGAAMTLFNGEPNDLIVSVASATAGPPSRAVLAECEHSAYTVNAAARSAIATAVAELPATIWGTLRW